MFLSQEKFLIEINHIDDLKIIYSALDLYNKEFSLTPPLRKTLIQMRKAILRKNKEV